MASDRQVLHERIEAGLRMERAQNYEGAVRVYRALVGEHPAEPGLHFHLAMAYLATLDFAAALASIRESIKLRPEVADFHALHATILRAMNRLDEGLRAVRRGLETSPDSLALLQAAGDALHVRGEVEEGIALLEPHRERGRQDPQFLAVLAQLYRARGDLQSAREALSDALAAPGLQGRAACWSHLQMGAVEEKLGRYEQAWEHYAAGNRHRGTVFDPDQHDAAVSEGIGLWSAETLAALPRAKNRKAEQLVFIVGMPRSGTSLVEQILASHPAVYGGGELNFVAQAGADLLRPTLAAPTVRQALQGLRQPVVDRVSRATQQLMTEPAPRAGRFTDKQPANFKHIGLIEVLFPQARIIQCLRDPRDVCLSCHTILFGGANSQPFAGDLGHLGRFYLGYERMMAHWRRVSTLPILPAVYEEGVRDLEGYARRLVEFVGLEFDDACLRFWETKRDVVTASTDQVRRPIYTSSIGRWKRFERQMTPLFEVLGLPPERAWVPAV